MAAAFKTGAYPNAFAEIGVGLDDANRRVARDFQTLFYGGDGERIYHDAPDGYGYLVDTGNNDVRTEGQSYGMMIAVQLDRKDIFDDIWRWTRTRMFQTSGANAGYFGWSAKLDGTLNSTGSAPDGEEFFAMSLLFASNRWGDGDGIFNYSNEPKALLHTMVHKTGLEMFDPATKLIRFIPNCNFSDPSYHLPHFYELFALWGDPEDAAFFHEAADLSRAYLRKACHPRTGLCAEYAEYDGTPVNRGDHDHFFSDAYRTAANIALDWEWFGKDPWQTEQATNIQNFFDGLDDEGWGRVYEIDGSAVTDPSRLAVPREEGQSQDVLHPLALLSTLAAASLASTSPKRGEFMQKFWNAELRTDRRRYYDNLLYMFALLALSGRYRVFSPKCR